MEVLTHKCPNCGGPLTFHPDDQKFHCDYCLSIFTEQEVTDFEAGEKESQTESVPEDKTKEQAQSADQDTVEMDLFTCPSCGAEIVTDATTAATYCYYCHNPVVLSGRISGKYRPEMVLPFGIEKKEAVEQFLEWTRKKWFIPKDFFNKKQIEKLTGVYFPYWGINAKISGSFSAKATKVRVWRAGDTEYTETKVYAVRRKGKISFKDFVKNALSKNTQQKMVSMVQPFRLDKSVDFKSQYLAGFQAEKRDIEIVDLQEEVNRELKDFSREIFKDTVAGYTSVTDTRASISIEDMQNKYLMLPVWILTYRSSDGSKKDYFYAMNGQTGKVSGILPISYQRLGLMSLGIFAGLLALLLIGGYLI